jgi:predicted dehydrogenase
MKKLKLAIVGCGWVAGTQMETGFRLLPELFEIVACCDVSGDRAREFAKRYGIGLALHSYDELLAMEGIDAVSICTPPSLHYAMVIAALEAGKHAICEKPFTSSLSLLDQVVEKQRKSDARVMPIFQYRFGPGFTRVRHLVESGLLGRAYMSSVETSWYRGPDYYKVPWRGKFETELGGVLLTQAIHIHDLFLSLMGPAKAVCGFKTTRVNKIEVEDCAAISLEMADGSLASLVATLGSARPTTRMRFCFENGTIERLAVDADAIKPANEPWSVIARDTETQAAFEEKMGEIEKPAQSFFARQFELFHGALASGEAFPVTLEDARRSLELITAIFEATEGGSTVHLPIAPDHPRYGGWIDDRP